MIKKENNRAVFTVLLMIAATLGAKATGMLRQMMTASIFAAGMEGVAFSAAAKIPFAIFDMLFSTGDSSITPRSFLPLSSCVQPVNNAVSPRIKRKDFFIIFCV